jgi:hypothetical protein
MLLNNVTIYSQCDNIFRFLKSTLNLTQDTDDKAGGIKNG